MASFITTLIAFSLVTAVVFGVLFGAFFTICRAIRREDGSGTVTGQAPSRVCQSVRYLTGLRSLRMA
jgi:hypothetical protein